MPNIIFTSHSLYKFSFFKKHKIIISTKQIKDAIINGKITDTTEYPKIQSVGEYDKNHSLVTIYKKDEKSIIVITFWIAEKGRYEN